MATNGFEFGYSGDMEKLRGGSLYQRSSDGMWVGSVDLGKDAEGKRIRKVVTSMDQATARAKLEVIAIPRPPFKSRSQLLAEARTRGTHTAKEWTAKLRSTRICRYCDADLNMFNVVKDHMIALESGGSDSLDNIQPICWECNKDKRTTPHDEFVYAGPKPRPFSVLPIRRAELARAQEARERFAEFNKRRAM